MLNSAGAEGSIRFVWPRMETVGMFGRKSSVWRPFTDRDAEHLCAHVMQDALGYTDAAVTARSGDGGLDIVSQHAVAQVKYQQAPVGRPALQQLAGASLSHPSKDRLFFSFSRYTQGAVNYADQVGVALFAVDTQGGYAGVNHLAGQVGTRRAKRKRGKPKPGSLEHQVQVEEIFRRLWMIAQAVGRWVWLMARELARVVAGSWRKSGPRLPPPEIVTYRRAIFGFLALALWGLIGARRNAEPPEFVPGVVFGWAVALICFGYFLYSTKQWFDLRRTQRTVPSDG